MGAGKLAPGYIQIPGVPWARFPPDTITHIYLVIISAVVLMARVRLFAQRLLHQQNSFFLMLFFTAHLSKTVGGTIFAFVHGHLKHYAQVFSL